MLQHFLILYFTVVLLALCAGKVSFYIATEHATVTHLNTTIVAEGNITSRRHGRRSQLYLVDIHYRSLVPFDDSLKVDFYFYEFLSNEYRRGFVEMHFGWCSLIHKNAFFGAAMLQGKLRGPCPYPPGDYHMYNMSIAPAAIPEGFPFTKGRIYANLTLLGAEVVGGYVDMELKPLRARTRDARPAKP